MGLGRSACYRQPADRSRLVARHAGRVIVDGTRPEQQVWRGTLEQLASDALEIDGCGAGTIVIGDVVAVGLKMAHGARDVAAPRLRARS